MTTTEPKTISEAVNLGKEWGIDTADTILALAISETLNSTLESNRVVLMMKLTKIFKAKCKEYKSKINDLTEEGKVLLKEAETLTIKK